MNRQRREIDILADGTKISHENLRDFGPLKTILRARDLTKLAERMIANDDHSGLGHELSNIGGIAYNSKQIYKIAQKGSAICRLVFINDELIGAATSESIRAAHTPIAIARPGHFSHRIRYWLSSPYTNDNDANLAVAQSLDRSYLTDEWQWDQVNPHYEQSKISAYQQLGMVLVDDGSDWQYDMSNSGTKGAELWARPPKEDNPVLAELMNRVNDEVLREKAEKDAR